jgi:hypothetical protein
MKKKEKKNEENRAEVRLKEESACQALSPICITSRKKKSVHVLI